MVECMKKGFSFSVDVKGRLNAIDDINKYVSKEVTKEIKKEINKTLQVANRRAENIENSKIASPAYKSLVNELSEKSKNRFSKFSIGGLDLNDKSQRVKVIDTYSRALSFLNNKTSTVTGAKKFVKDIADKNGISFEVANEMIDVITSPKITNGEIVINNWDSERVANMVSEFSTEYRDTYKTKDEYFKEMNEQINNAINDSNVKNIDIWDL